MPTAYQDGPSKPAPMAAITSIANPVSQENYLAFYNDANNLLGVAQQSKGNLGPPLYDFSSAASKDVPAGAIANPSSMTCTLFQSQVRTIFCFFLNQNNPLRNHRSTSMESLPGSPGAIYLSAGCLPASNFLILGIPHWQRPAASRPVATATTMERCST